MNYHNSSDLIEITPAEKQSLAYHAETNTQVLDSIADQVAETIKSSDKKTKVIVTIPAHNEEAIIPKCLKAFTDQYAMADVQIDFSEFEVLVLCHNCTDKTFQICNEIKMNSPFLNLYILNVALPEVNNVGAVRRVLMRIAEKRMNLNNGYIVSTDADTIVGRYWIANILGYIGSGYGLICGRIDINMRGLSGNARKTLHHKQNYFQLRARLEHLISPDLTDPWPRHAHNSGPNLAIRKDVYRSIGGMPPKGFLEDIALYDAVCEQGHKIRHCPYTIVVTSCRLTPRAPWGFGSELRDWTEAEDIFFQVEGLNRLLEKFDVFEKVRRYVKKSSSHLVNEICQITGLEKSKIMDYFITYSSSRSIINSIDRDLDNLESWQIKYPLKLVSEAEKELQTYLGMVKVDFDHT